MEFERADVRVVVAEAGEVFLEHEGVELTDGRGGGGDDADVLFEAGPEHYGRLAPWRRRLSTSKTALVSEVCTGRNTHRCSPCL